LNGDGKNELLLSSTLDLFQGYSKIHIYGTAESGGLKKFSELWDNSPNYYRHGLNLVNKKVVACVFV